MKREVEMQFDKMTKGAVRYAELGNPDEAILRTLYVRKLAFEEVEGNELPKKIKVTIEFNVVKAEEV